MSRVAPSIEKFEFCTEQNIIGTQNLLIAARDAKVRKLVYSGSSTYYGNCAAPQKEDLLPECLIPTRFPNMSGSNSAKSSPGSIISPL